MRAALSGVVLGRLLAPIEELQDVQAVGCLFNSGSISPILCCGVHCTVGKPKQS